MTGPWFVWPLYLAALVAFWFGVPYFGRAMETYWSKRGVPTSGDAIVLIFRSVIGLLSIFWVSALIVTLAH